MEERGSFWSMTSVHHGEGVMKFMALGAPYILVARKNRASPETRITYHLQSSFPIIPLLLDRLATVPKAPPPPQTLLLTGNQGSKHMILWRIFDSQIVRACYAA